MHTKVNKKMNMGTKIHNWGQYSLLLALTFIIVGCERSAYSQVKITPQPASQAMVDALITLDDAPKIMREGKWAIRESPNVMNTWRWLNPVSVVSRDLAHWDKDRGEVPIEHLIAQYSSDRIAISVWEALRRAQIIDTFANVVTKEVSILPENGRPILAADDILYRCERYYEETRFTYCIARLRYGRYYTHLIGYITDEALSTEQFFELMKRVNSRMQLLEANDE